MAQEATAPRTGAEMALAFWVGASWFAFSALVAATPVESTAALVVAAVVLDVLAVFAVAHFWDIPYAVTVGVAGAVAIDWFFIPPTHPLEIPDARNTLALVVYLVMAALLGELAVRARRDAVSSERARSELAEEQAALRRVATLVAQETAPSEVFAAVAEEVGRLLEVELATMLRYEDDATATVVASWSTGPELPVGARVPLEGLNVAGTVRRTGAPSRVDRFTDAPGLLAARLRDLGVRSASGSPIVVDGNVWGVMVAATRSHEPIAPGTETRLGQFTELVASAVANTQNRSELVASRRRIVSAADDARRHIERNLHDGVQQRLVSLALGLRLASDGSAPDVRAQLAAIQDGLVGAVDDLRELSQGIHPAVLSEGGLRPALATLARRSAVPVEVTYDGPERFEEPVEVAAYFIVSEALANVVKHASASGVTVDVDGSDAELVVTVRDDGVGGADQGSGTGLLGLRDRAAALGGRVTVASPVGEGTTLRVVLPREPLDGSAGPVLEEGTDRVP